MLTLIRPASHLIMLNPLGVFLLILPTSSVLAQTSETEPDCNITATFGSTMINVSWEPCGAIGTNVHHYDIFLVDIVLFTFDVEATVECRKEQCEYTFGLVKPCLEYNISLVMTLNNGTNNTNNTAYNYNTLTGRAGEEIPTAVTLNGVTTGFSVDSTTESSMTISWFPPETGILNIKYIFSNVLYNFYSRGKYCVKGYLISWWKSYGSDLPVNKDNVTIDKISEVVEKQTFVIQNVSACSDYQVMVSPFYSNDSRQAYGVVNSGKTGWKEPGRPRDLSSTYRGYDYIELEWTDTEDLSCVRGLSINCIAGSQDSLGFTRQPPVSPRKGRVTHLSPCTNYTCTVAYPDQDNAWSIRSDPVNQSTWVRGVTISRPTKLQLYTVGRDLHLAWAGPEEGGGCVTEYSLTYTNLNSSHQLNHTVPAHSPYLHVLPDIEPGVQYNILLAPRSKGWGDDVTGETAEENVDTGDLDLHRHDHH